MANTHFAMFSCLFMYVSMAMATDDACVGQACSSEGSGIAAPWAAGEDYPQGLEMLQLNAARGFQTPAPVEVDPAETPIATEATPKFASQCAKTDRVFKVRNVTGAECQQACAVNEFCKFWSHMTDMDRRTGDCLGCKGVFEEAPGYTVMAVGDLLVTQVKVECLNVGFIRKEPNTGPTCEEPNTYCGSPGSPNCETDTDESTTHRRRGSITKFDGKRPCKCGNETGYSEAGNWCRNCLPYPLGTTDVAAVTQAFPLEGDDELDKSLSKVLEPSTKAADKDKNVSALGLGENISQVWFVPKLFLRRPFQLCCDERKWEKGCPTCCGNKKEECHAKCPKDDQKACMADCAFQETMCSRLCSDQIRFDKAISAGMKGLELQCEKLEDEEEEEEEASEEETDEEEEDSEEDSEDEASDEDSEDEEAEEEDSEEEAEDDEEKEKDEDEEKDEEKEEEKEEEKKDEKEEEKKEEKKDEKEEKKEEKKDEKEEKKDKK